MSQTQITNPRQGNNLSQAARIPGLVIAGALGLFFPAYQAGIFDMALIYLLMLSGLVCWMICSIAVKSIKHFIIWFIGGSLFAYLEVYFVLNDGNPVWRVIYGVMLPSSFGILCLVIGRKWMINSQTNV